MISPLLANIYLHYVFDLWARRWRQRSSPTADVIMRAYADDIVVGFEHQADAERFLAEMRERLADVRPDAAPGQDAPIEFGRYAAENRRERGLGKPETFDFLGFTHICGRSRKGGFQLIGRHARSDAGANCGRSRRAAAPDAHDDRRAGGVAAAGRGRLLRLSRRARPTPRSGDFRHHVTDLWRARCGGAARRTRHVAADRPCSPIAGFPSRASSTLGRASLSPSNTQGGSPVREIRPPVLCGGRPVMGVPTATRGLLRACEPIDLGLDRRRASPLSRGQALRDSRCAASSG